MSVEYTPTGESWTCDICGRKMVEVSKPWDGSPTEESVGTVICQCQKRAFIPKRYSSIPGTPEEDTVLYIWFDEEALVTA